MIQIKDINFGLSVANGVDWFIPEYRTNAGELLTAVAILCKDGEPINNWDGGKIGIKIGIPTEVKSEWGKDDSVIEDFILSSIGAVRL